MASLFVEPTQRRPRAIKMPRRSFFLGRRTPRRKMKLKQVVAPKLHARQFAPSRLASIVARIIKPSACLTPSPHTASRTHPDPLLRRSMWPGDLFFDDIGLSAPLLSPPLDVGLASSPDTIVDSTVVIMASRRLPC